MLPSLNGRKPAATMPTVFIAIRFLFRLMTTDYKWEVPPLAAERMLVLVQALTSEPMEVTGLPNLLKKENKTMVWLDCMVNYPDLWKIATRIAKILGCKIKKGSR